MSSQLTAASPVASSVFHPLLHLLGLHPRSAENSTDILLAGFLRQLRSRMSDIEAIKTIMVAILTAPVTRMSITNDAVALWGPDQPMCIVDWWPEEERQRLREACLALSTVDDVFHHRLIRRTGRVAMERPTSTVVGHLEATNWRIDATRAILQSFDRCMRTCEGARGPGVTYMKAGAAAAIARLYIIRLNDKPVPNVPQGVVPEEQRNHVDRILMQVLGHPQQ